MSIHQHIAASLRNQPRYVGRFAPTPSGDLHFGSLVTALGSYLDAKHHGGSWLLRIDDLDADRSRPHAVTSILRDLESYALFWDGEITFQSKRRLVYQRFLHDLTARANHVYRCSCSRRALSDRGVSAGNYDGRCRRILAAPERPHSWRINVNGMVVQYDDLIRGPQLVNLGEVDDFVIWRSNDIPSYQLATVLDDYFMGVSVVMRGADLLHATYQQHALLRLLGLGVPAYGHLPTVLDAHGRKLSKSTGSAPLQQMISPSKILIKALELLGQHPPAELKEGDATIQEIVSWGSANWSRSLVPIRSIKMLDV